MKEFMAVLAQNGGVVFGILGAALAVLLAGLGSARGVQMAGKLLQDWLLMNLKNLVRQWYCNYCRVHKDFTDL